MAVRRRPSSITPRANVAIVGDDPGTLPWLLDILHGYGVRTYVANGLGDLCKVARSPLLRAVIVDLDLVSRKVGTHHLILMVRQLYPSLTVVALSGTSNHTAKALIAV